MQTKPSRKAELLAEFEAALKIAKEEGMSEERAQSIIRKVFRKKDEKKIIWQYQANDGTWLNYDPEASDFVDEMYRNGEPDVRSVKSGQWEYQVDFLVMKQTNTQKDNNRIRDVRRIEKEEKKEEEKKEEKEEKKEEEKEKKEEKK